MHNNFYAGCLIIYFWFFGFGLNHLQAQDPYFSQYYTNKIQLNPALTGYDRGMMFSTITRNQWYGLEKGTPFLTSSAELSWEVPNLFSGYVIQNQINREGAAPINWHKAGISYAFRNRSCLSGHQKIEWALGFQANYNYLAINYDRLVFRSMLHPLDGQVVDRPPDELYNFNRDKYFDLAFGAMVRLQPVEDDDQVVLGFSAHHLGNRGGFLGTANQNTLRYSFHASYEQNEAFRQTGLYFTPTFRTDIQSASAWWAKDGFRSMFTQIGSVVTIGTDNKFWVGGWYRGRIIRSQTLDVKGNIHAIILGIGFRNLYNSSFRRGSNNWQAGITYDYNISGNGRGLIGDGNGTLEFFLTFNLPQATWAQCSGIRVCPPTL
ncbi:MAG: PorP/SprF family type IX secretion system membrane protein [Bacteroidia bacterium]